MCSVVCVALVLLMVLVRSWFGGLSVFVHWWFGGLCMGLGGSGCGGGGWRAVGGKRQARKRWDGLGCEV